MGKTNIEWTATRNVDGSASKGDTWNPTTGCTKISQGCKFCYAEIMHRRLAAMGQPKYAQPFKTLVCHPDELDRNFGRKPKFIFVNSMSDLFHEDVPVAFIQQTIAVIATWPQHIFQVLTKRPDRMHELHQRGLLAWPPNLWMGTSIEQDSERWRLKFLVEGCGAPVKFLSLEPLIGPLPNLVLAGVDWVIVGGEAARKPRPMLPEWAQHIQQTCRQQGVAFFFKQWGGVNKKAAGRLLNGRTFDEMPNHTR